MKRLIALLTTTALLALAPAAQAAFGLNSFDVTYTNQDGSTATQSGSHPYAQTTSIAMNLADGEDYPAAWLDDVILPQIPGFVADTTAYAYCSRADFDTTVEGIPGCPSQTQVGISANEVGTPGTWFTAPVFNLEPPPGVVLTLGFLAVAPRIVIDVVISPEPPFNPIAIARNTPQLVDIFSVKTQLWGNPSSPLLDTMRGLCGTYVTSHPSRDVEGFEFDPALGQGSSCPADPGDAFLTLPTDCSEPLLNSFEVTSWGGESDAGGRLTHDELGDPQPFTECESLDFEPEVAAAPTTNAAESPSGFDFSIAIDDPGLTDPSGRAQAHLKKAVVTLPRGLAVNPAAAGGLGACSQDQLARESATSTFGEGCPAASRVASVEVTTPLLAEQLNGSIFLATPYDNPLGELLAGYLVIKSAERGIAIKLAGKIEADPETGQITASFDQNPQFPFSDLRVAFTPGPRAPLITPPACGDYEIKTELYPWSGNAPDVSTQPFTISQSPTGGPCPTSEAALPHAPGFDAGTVSPISAAHSPFVLNLRREDGSQRFSAVRLTPPPGLVAKLAGTAICSDGDLAAAASKSGKAEQSTPSCPLDSRIGNVDAAVGAGPAPYNAPATAYLTGPYKSAPLSMAVIAPAVAGPFDLGTIVSRVALHVDPRTAEITAVSDPLPTILEGIPLDIRRLSVRLDKPDFTLTGTSCDPLAVSGLLTSTLGQVASLSNRYQLSDCTRLGFKPRMTLRLRGGTKRGAHPALTIALAPRPGDANIASVSVALPRSEFLENAHIRTICTRPDFAADQCPAGAVYGEATVDTPLLDYDLAGHVYLRSSDNLLPDVVPDLRGPAYQPIRLETAGRTDSVRGGIRTTIDFVPDAPFTKATVALQGGNKGLLVNSRDICARTYRATVKYTAHNGRTFVAKPKMLVRCGGKKGGKKKAKRRGHRRAKAIAHRGAVR